jgi:hypothetical protein
LVGGTSIAKLNKEISDEYDLDYINKQEKEEMDIDLIKEGLLAHYLETGEWLTMHKRETPDSKNGSFVIKYGEYAGEITVGGLNTNLAHGVRGLPGGSSVSRLNKELKEELEQGSLVLVDTGEQDIQPTME